MLTAVDPKTQKSLPDSNVLSQTLTFLVAGHDSTSTAITGLIYHLSSHPQVEAKLLQEISEVVKDEPFSWNHLSRLKYTQKVINENLRLLPPAAAFNKVATQDTVLGNYFIPKDTKAMLNIWATHYNEEYWKDPELFIPERFDDELVAKRPQFSYLPFSYGPRACIGQQLSMIEQKIFLVMVYSRFHFRLHKSANMHLTFPLFAKPNGIIMLISTRSTNVSSVISNTDSQEVEPQPLVPLNLTLKTSSSEDKKDYLITILYGSNMETCKQFAEQIFIKGKSLGFSAYINSMDEYLKKPIVFTPRNSLILLCSTYNGEPPDNAREFHTLLTKKQDQVKKLFSGVKYIVFGSGNSQWRRTFLHFPLLVDQVLENVGAERFGEFGKGDCDKSIDDDFAQWQQNMWAQLHSILELTANITETSSFRTIKMKIVNEPEHLDKLDQIRSNFGKLNNAFRTKIKENKELQSINSGRSTKHLEIILPEGQTYIAGDHLAVFPINDLSIVHKVAQILNIDPKTVVVLDTKDPDPYLPFDIPSSVEIILRFCVELQLPATRAQISYLVNNTECPPEKKALEFLANPSSDPNSPKSYEEYIVKYKRTLVEVLEEFKSVKLNFAEFLSLLPVLRPRYYSISSGHSAYPNTAQITVAVVKEKSPTGRDHIGVGSNFLSNLKVNESIALMMVKRSNFKLPSDPSRPIIMVGPGTGVAPLRGFIQERRATKAPGEIVLFFGCRDENDFIYKEEFYAHQKEGILAHLFVAFSRAQSRKVYVQELIEDNSSIVYPLIKKGAYIYVCGDARNMAPSVKKSFAKVLQIESQKTEEMALEEISSLCYEGRYLEDVWA